MPQLSYASVETPPNLGAIIRPLSSATRSRLEQFGIVLGDDQLTYDPNHLTAANAYCRDLYRQQDSDELPLTDDPDIVAAILYAIAHA